MVALSRSWVASSRPPPPGRARSASHRHLTSIAFFIGRGLRLGGGRRGTGSQARHVPRSPAPKPTRGGMPTDRPPQTPTTTPLKAAWPSSRGADAPLQAPKCRHRGRAGALWVAWCIPSWARSLRSRAQDGIHLRSLIAPTFAPFGRGAHPRGRP